MSPPGLITLAIAAGIGGAILGIKKIFNLARTAQTGGGEFTEKHNELDQKLKDAGMDISGTNSAIRGSARRNIDPETGGRTEEQEAIYQEVKAERDRINALKKQMRAEMDASTAEIKGSYGTSRLSGLKEKERRERISASKEEIRKKYEKLINPSSTTTISNSTSSSNVNISNNTTERNLSAVEEATPTVTVNNLESKKNGDQPLKSGRQSNVPLIATSNPNNFYSTFSQTQYGVVV